MEYKNKKTIVIKPTLDCNLRCRYCYEFNRTTYNDLSEVSLDIDAYISIMRKVAMGIPGARILWMLHGGEPLLIGEKNFRRIVLVMRELNKNQNVDFKIAMQTNGTLISDSWIELFLEYQDLFSERTLGISIDGSKIINDRSRVTIKNTSIHDKLISNIEKLHASDIKFGTLSVVGMHNLNHVQDVYSYINSLNPYYSKFIPCYNFSLSGETERLGITPTQYANFMCQLFDCWIRDLPNIKNGKWRVIDPIATLLASVSDSFLSWCEYCSNKCDNFISIFPNGDIWLCDVFQQDSHKEYAFLGNIHKIESKSLALVFFNSRSYCKFTDLETELTRYCSKCKIRKYCNGGCFAQRLTLRQLSEELFREYCKAKQILISFIKETVERAMPESEGKL